MSARRTEHNHSRKMTTKYWNRITRRHSFSPVDSQSWTLKADDQDQISLSTTGDLLAAQRGTSDTTEQRSPSTLTSNRQSIVPGASMSIVSDSHTPVSVGADQAALKTLWEEPSFVVRRVPSDAAMQLTRTSDRMSRAMIPANHAKTPENCRYDFFEDSMAMSLIGEFGLYALDWTSSVATKELEKHIRAVLNKFVVALAPIFISDAVCLDVSRSCDAWKNYRFVKEPIANVSNKTNNTNRTLDTATCQDCFVTCSYLTRRFLLETAADATHQHQNLFPASIVQYIVRRGVENSESAESLIVPDNADQARFATCKYDAAKILTDYDKLQRGPWGR